jgi:hypothetical protein
MADEAGRGRRTGTSGKSSTKKSIRHKTGVKLTATKQRRVSLPLLRSQKPGGNRARQCQDFRGYPFSLNSTRQWLGRRRARTPVAPSTLELRQLLHRPEQVIRLGQYCILKNRLIGDESIRSGDALHRCIKMMEQLVGDSGSNLRTVSPA